MSDFDRPTTTPPPDRAAPPATDTDTTAVPVATSTIEQPSSRRSAPRRDRARMIAAGALIAIVVGLTAVATLVLTGASPTSAVLGYVPAESVAYGEVRLDLPGDQRQKVGQFLSKFPGFADQAALETKLDEVLDRLVSEGSAGKQTYTRDVKPWFDGQLGFAMGPIPSGAPGDASAAVKDARAILLLSVRDPAVARTWFTNTLSQAGVTGTTETHNGTELTLFSDPKAPDKQAGFAIAGNKVAIAGDVASVKAALDTNGSSPLASGEAVTAARASLTGDDLGFMFFDVKSLVETSVEAAGAAASVPVSSALTAVVPDWAAMRMRVESDALRFDAVTQHKEGMPGPDQNRANGVAGYAPASTIALLSGNDYGQTLLESIELYRNQPGLGEAFTQLEQAAGMLGGLDALLGWMGDTGVVVAKAGDGVEGGFVSIPANAASGRQLLTTLRSFLQLGGGDAGITVRDEEYNGSTITVVDLGDLRDLAGLAGMMGGGQLPADPSSLPQGNVQLAYVANDDVIAIGSSVDFIKHVLDAGAGASLADDARFQALVGRVDAQHNGLSFVDLTAVRELVEGAMGSASAAERAEYEESVKPFLTPLDALVSTGTVGGDRDQMHTVITVK